MFIIYYTVTSVSSLKGVFLSLDFSIQNSIRDFALRVCTIILITEKTNLFTRYMYIANAILNFQNKNTNLHNLHIISLDKGL